VLRSSTTWQSETFMNTPLRVNLLYAPLMLQIASLHFAPLAMTPLEVSLRVGLIFRPTKQSVTFRSSPLSPLPLNN
jgi:hypothetical protein